MAVAIWSRCAFVFLNLLCFHSSLSSFLQRWSSIIATRFVLKLNWEQTGSEIDFFLPARNICGLWFRFCGYFMTSWIASARCTVHHLWQRVQHRLGKKLGIFFNKHVQPEVSKREVCIIRVVQIIILCEFRHWTFCPRRPLCMLASIQESSANSQEVYSFWNVPIKNYSYFVYILLIVAIKLFFPTSSFGKLGFCSVVQIRYVAMFLAKWAVKSTFHKSAQSFSSGGQGYSKN